VGDIAQGLTLSVIGMTITFAALGLLILTIVVLNHLFRPRPLVSGAEELGETRAVNLSVRDTEDEEIVAAIAVVLALRSLDVSRSGLGTALEAGRGPWWVKSQLQQRPTDTLTSQRRRQQ
jgi:Na+-transporting methylmalonyl-CoA/oxaloacetate decarboxylase gamma subunit